MSSYCAFDDRSFDEFEDECSTDSGFEKSYESPDLSFSFAPRKLDFGPSNHVTKNESNKYEVKSENVMQFKVTMEFDKKIFFYIFGS